MTEEATKMTIREKNVSIYQSLKWPSVVLTTCASAYLGLKSGSWIWFSWHPVSMLLGAVALPLNAVLIKKIGGLENTRMHGKLLTLASLSMFFGTYVIWSNKELYNKPHFMTYHSWTGLAALGGMLGLLIGGTFLLHPDYGLLKTSSILRKTHKYSGRAIMALAWGTCVSGFYTMQPSLALTIAFSAPLVAASYFTLL
mmetsp:Transcript_9959/g.17450  ORF Transcript_9959/g.17450 Transcript_9959/m.17450 type:complete len:198 (+) Transcript_9959:65-658(+)